MGIIQDIIAKYRAKKEHEKELVGEMRLQHKLTERQKDANERELERYHEEARKAAVESELKEWRHNMFTNNDFLFKDKVFLGRYY